MKVKYTDTDTDTDIQMPDLTITSLEWAYPVLLDSIYYDQLFFSHFSVIQLIAMTAVNWRSVRSVISPTTSLNGATSCKAGIVSIFCGKLWPKCKT